MGETISLPSACVTRYRMSIGGPRRRSRYTSCLEKRPASAPRRRANAQDAGRESRARFVSPFCRHKPFLSNSLRSIHKCAHSKFLKAPFPKRFAKRQNLCKKICLASANHLFWIARLRGMLQIVESFWQRAEGQRVQLCVATLKVMNSLEAS